MAWTRWECILRCKTTEWACLLRWECPKCPRECPKECPRECPRCREEVTCPEKCTREHRYPRDPDCRPSEKVWPRPQTPTTCPSTCLTTATTSPTPPDTTARASQTRPTECQDLSVSFVFGSPVGSVVDPCHLLHVDPTNPFIRCSFLLEENLKRIQLNF